MAIRKTNRPVGVSKKQIRAMATAARVAAKKQSK
jgi:hypothetical protein